MLYNLINLICVASGNLDPVLLNAGLSELFLKYKIHSKTYLERSKSSLMGNEVVAFVSLTLLCSNICHVRIYCIGMSVMY